VNREEMGALAVERLDAWLAAECPDGKTNCAEHITSNVHGVRQQYEALHALWAARA
jgi:hypothetical protein